MKNKFDNLILFAFIIQTFIIILMILDFSIMTTMKQLFWNNFILSHVIMFIMSLLVFNVFAREKTSKTLNIIIVPIAFMFNIYSLLILMVYSLKFYDFKISHFCLFMIELASLLILYVVILEPKASLLLRNKFILREKT